ncbi:MAG: ATP-binding protein, partial [Nocardioidaceae bacterium]|nr:ATP-binding protein [Nocardioidaceae bacterium]
MDARVILLAGPSGAGKSRLAARSRLPILQLDDFYRDGDDPSLPRFDDGAVDWDHPQSWDPDAALAAVFDLCHEGKTDTPVYEISANRRVGSQVLELDGSAHVIAEGIFAGELVAGCQRAGVLEKAICVRRSRWLTFVLRLTRDLREHRKAPLVLLRRGWRLTWQEPAIVAALEAAGCTAMTPRQTEQFLAT